MSEKVKKGIGGALKTNKDINHNSLVNEMDVFAFELKALSHTNTVKNKTKQDFSPVTRPWYIRNRIEK